MFAVSHPDRTSSGRPAAFAPLALTLVFLVACEGGKRWTPSDAATGDSKGGDAQVPNGTGGGTVDGGAGGSVVGSGGNGGGAAGADGSGGAGGSGAIGGSGSGGASGTGGAPPGSGGSSSGGSGTGGRGTGGAATGGSGTGGSGTGGRGTGGSGSGSGGQGTGGASSCVSGLACQPANSCKTGTTACPGGVSTCMESGNKTNGTTCGAGPSCSNARIVGQWTCQSGTCTKPEAQNCPNGYACVGSSCKTSCDGVNDCVSGYVCTSSHVCTPPCTKDADCSGSSYCNTSNGMCTPKGAAGAKCGGNTQCTSGSCKDEICCSASCSLDCQSCAASKTGKANGTCAPKMVDGSKPTVPKCGNECPGGPGGYVECSGENTGNVCSRTAWTFDPRPPTPVAGDESGEWSGHSEPIISYVQSPPHGATGSYVARMSNSVDALDGQYSSYARTLLCPAGGTMNLNGKQVSLWVYIDNPSFSTQPCDVYLASKFGDMESWRFSITPGEPKKWFRASATIGASATAGQIGVSCQFENGSSGSVIIDDVVISN